MSMLQLNTLFMHVIPADFAHEAFVCNLSIALQSGEPTARKRKEKKRKKRKEKKRKEKKRKEKKRKEKKRKEKKRKDLDGTVLQFATAARPAKRAFAFHAEMGLHYGSDKKWPAATKLHIPSFAWSSETCDSEIRERFFGDLMELSSAATASDAESDVDLEALALSS